MIKKINRVMLFSVSILLFVAVIIWFNCALSNTGKVTDEHQLNAVRQSVENAVTMCYSIEGSYPEDLKYLTESYGVVYDSSKYIIHYESIGANIRPTVTVIERNAQ